MSPISIRTQKKENLQHSRTIVKNTEQNSMEINKNANPRKSESSKLSVRRQATNDRSNMPVTFNFMHFNSAYESMRFKLIQSTQAIEKESYANEAILRDQVITKLCRHRLDEWNNIPLPILSVFK